MVTIKEKLGPFYIPISHEGETGDEAYVSSMRSLDISLYGEIRQRTFLEDILLRALLAHLKVT